MSTYLILCIVLLITGLYCSRKCSPNMFLNFNGICQKFLTCKDIQHVKLKQEIESGYVKKLYIGVYDNLEVVYSRPRSQHLKGDFLHGLHMLIAFQESEFVVDLIGYCLEDLILVTRYYRFGSSDQLNNILAKQKFSQEKEFQIRINLSLDYLSVLEFLHNSPLGVRVMCDSNDLMKTLSQFLITDDFRLVVSDLDALPEVIAEKNISIKCGHRQLFGDFVAPEQLWPHEHLLFDDLKMKGYNEKIDIWKIPNVLQYLVGDQTLSKRLKFHMFNLFMQCKQETSSLRPSAAKIGSALVSVVDKLTKSEL